MDMFGIGQAIQSCAQIYFRSAIQTGRTTHLLASLKDGDRVVFARNELARDFEKKAIRRGLKIRVTSVSPKDPGRLFEKGQGKGRTVFDHGWLEQFYLHNIRQLNLDIDKLQTDLSGFGEPHLKTQMKAMDMRKWWIE